MPKPPSAQAKFVKKTPTRIAKAPSRAPVTKAPTIKKTRSTGGGIDLPKFAGEVATNVGKALDAALPSRQASSTVSRAMKAPSVRGGNSIGVKPTDPVSTFMSNFIEIKRKSK